MISTKDYPDTQAVVEAVKAAFAAGASSVEVEAIWGDYMPDGAPSPAAVTDWLVSDGFEVIEADEYESCYLGDAWLARLTVRRR